MDKERLEYLEKMLSKIDVSNTLSEENYLQSWNQLETHFELREKLSKEESRPYLWFKNFKKKVELKYSDYPKLKVFMTAIIFEDLAKKYINEFTDLIANESLIISENDIRNLKNVKILMQLKGFDISNYQPVIELLELNGLVKNEKPIIQATPGNSENPHPRYFKEPVHWQIFKDWQQQNVGLANYSFIYRVMFADGFIHMGIGQNEFKEWIKSTFSTDLGKQLKQLDISATPAKYSLYASLIDKYKLISITLQKRSINTLKT